MGTMNIDLTGFAKGLIFDEGHQGQDAAAWYCPDSSGKTLEPGQLI